MIMIMMMMMMMKMKKTVWKSKQFQYLPGTYIYISQYFWAYFTSVTDGSLQSPIYSGFPFNYRISWCDHNEDLKLLTSVNMLSYAFRINIQFSPISCCCFSQFSFKFFSLSVFLLLIFSFFFLLLWIRYQWNPANLINKLF